jgi:hypothetical protein
MDEADALMARTEDEIETAKERIMQLLEKRRAKAEAKQKTAEGAGEGEQTPDDT